MVSLINASAIKSHGGHSVALSLAEGAAYLRRYSGSKMRLWIYDRTHSKLVLRALQVPSQLPPIDVLFSSTDDVRSPAVWTVGEVEIKADAQQIRFLDPSADVAIAASDFVIVVQDEFPSSTWEFQPFSQNA